MGVELYGELMVTVLLTFFVLFVLISFNILLISILIHDFKNYIERKKEHED